MSTFHLFLLPGLLAGESSELFLFQTYDTEFGTHCCFCKDWQEIEVVQSQGEAQTCFHPNLKHWEVMIWQRLFAKLWWEGMVYPDHLHQVNVRRRGPHSHASSSYVSLIWSPPLFYILVYFLLLHFHSYYFIQHIFNSRHSALYLTYIISFNPYNNLVK